MTLVEACRILSSDVSVKLFKALDSHPNLSAYKLTKTANLSSLNRGDVRQRLVIWENLGLVKGTLGQWGGSTSLYRRGERLNPHAPPHYVTLWSMNTDSELYQTARKIIQLGPS